MTDGELMAATVAILDATGSAKGTGFLIADDGAIVTCVHVLNNAAVHPGQTVGVEFRGVDPSKSLVATINPAQYDENADVAIIRLTSPVPAGVRPLELSEPSTGGSRPIRALGYPKGFEPAYWADGRILAMRADGSLQLSSEEITQGFSGGPILDVKVGRIVGISQIAEEADALGRLRTTAHAIPVTRLRHSPWNLSISRVLTPLETNSARGKQFAEVSKRYFHTRVIRGLFVSPPEFELHYRLFQRTPEAISQVQAALAALPATLRRQLGEDSAPFFKPSEGVNFDAPLSEASAAVAKGDMADLRRAHNAIVATVTRLNRIIGPFTSREYYEAWSGFLTSFQMVAEDMYATLGHAFRWMSNLWILVTPAGRGKSTFAHRVAAKLIEDGESVCVLVGPDLDGTAPIEELILRQLRPNLVDDFCRAAEDLFGATGRPFFVVIDAINESSAEPARIAAQLGQFLSLADGHPWLRLLITCRDLYWDLVFKEELSGYLPGAQLDEQADVSPALDDRGIKAYLEHFNVRNVMPADFVGSEWSANPLFLRLFCEVNAGDEYRDPKPIQVSAFKLLRRYFERKEAELKKRTFGLIELEPLLDRLAVAMVERRGVAGASENGLPRLALDAAEARALLDHRSLSSVHLFDALIDLDLVLRVDISKKQKRYVTFSFERMQDYFVSRVALQRMVANEEISDESFARIRASGSFTPSALSTTLALALERGAVKSLHGLTSEARSSLPAVFDLVERTRLAEIGPSIVDLLQSQDAMEPVVKYLEAQIRAQTGDRRAFSETLGLEFLTDAVWRLDLRERHLRFFAKRGLIEAMADVLDAEIERMRDWVRGSREFPSHYSSDDGRIRSVILLLGSNSPDVRNIAHEWLFWFGHFNTNRIYSLIEENFAVSDLLIRERVIALAHALLVRHDALTTPERLGRLYRNTLDEKSAAYVPHYLITEFARKTFLHYRSRYPALLPPNVWEVIHSPVRLREPQSKLGGYSHSAEPEWIVRGPIGNDQSHYTFGHQFSSFAVPSLDLAVRTALRMLRRLGYEERAYEQVDKAIARLSDNPRMGRGLSRRFERFGKTYGYVASWIVLGMWATRKPITTDVAHPEKPFSLAHPDYDPFFGVDPADEVHAPTVLDFPEQLSWEEWKAYDETVHVHTFAESFPEEEILHGWVVHFKGARRFSALTRCVLLPHELRNAYAWSVEYLARRRRQACPSFLPEERSEDFAFDDLGSETFPEDPFAEGTLIAAASNRVRTLGNQDREVVTATSRLIVACEMIQRPVAGEFDDRSGNRIVRCLRWQDAGSQGHGDLVLIKREILLQGCAKTGVAYGFLEYLKLIGLNSEGNWDEDREHLHQRWTGRFPGAASAPAFVKTLLEQFEAVHGVTALGFDDVVECCRQADIGGEAAMRDALQRMVRRVATVEIGGKRLRLSQVKHFLDAANAAESLTDEQGAEVLNEIRGDLDEEDAVQNVDLEE